MMDKVSELYIRYAHLPDRGHYDYFTDMLDPLSTASLSLTVPTTQAGYYDILVRGSDEPQPATPFTILAKLVPFSLTAVSASHIGDNGQVTLTLHGAKFVAGATVMLIGGDGTGIPASLVTVQDGGIVAPVLAKLGYPPAAVRSTLAPALEALPRAPGG